MCEGLVGAGNKSVNDQGRGTSGASGALAPEAVWCVGAGGLWRRKGWETLSSQTPAKTDSVGGQTASGAWAGTAHYSGCPDGETGRNCTQRWISQGLPWRTDGEGGVAVFTDTRPLTAGRPAAVLHVAAGSYVGASEDGSLSFEVERGVHFWGGGPRKCGVLRRARAGDGPGAKLLPAADYDRVGHTESGATKNRRRYLT